MTLVKKVFKKITKKKTLLKKTGSQKTMTKVSSHLASPLKKKTKTSNKTARTFPTTIRIKLKLPKTPILPWRETLPNEKWIGIVEDYLAQQQVFITTLQTPLTLGEHIHIRGCTTDILQTIDSMEWNHKALSHAESGQTVGIKTSHKVRKHDYIYLISTPI
jgi:hypothetical protein